MTIVGRIDSLWRYPVKSMRGEPLTEAFIGFPGIYGDRVYAVRSTAQPAGFPFLTGREQAQMLLYRPRFRHAETAARPTNLAAAEAMGPGVTPLYADPADLAVDVETPSGEVLAVDDPALLGRLGDAASLALLRSERALTDCRSRCSACRPRASLPPRSACRSTSGASGPTSMPTWPTPPDSPKTASSAAGCGSAPRPWSLSSSAIRAAR
jgi:hypothetical protein